MAEQKEMTEQEWLKHNDLSLAIYDKKYRNGNETFDEFLDRVSGHNDTVKELIKEKKFIFGGRILASRGIADRKVTYSNCFSGKTKIMTDQGLRTLEELAGTYTNVLSKSSWRKAEIREFGIQPVCILTLRRGKTLREFRVTPDHVWIVQKNQQRVLVKTEELNIGDVIPTEVLKCYRTYKPSPFGVAHGLFMGDGDHVDKKSLRMNLCGDKKELLPYFTPDTVGMSGDTTTICGMPKFFLNYPSLSESTSYLYGWLAGYFAADGSIDERGSCVVCSTNKKDLEYVQNLLCVLGIPCESIREQERISNLTGKIGTIYILNLNKQYLNENFFVLSKHLKRFQENPPIKKSEWKVESIENIADTEKVYCAVVPETECFALEGGILTHNCYVISPPEDNIESIFECCSKLAKTYSYGGGCGTDLSKLRPNGAAVHNASKTSSGPVSFMDMFSQVTQTISQNGRRGALMLSLDVRHPDIEEFIDCKTDLNRVNYANISVRITNEFMQAVNNNSDYLLHWPCNMDINAQEIENIDEYGKLVLVETQCGPVYLKKVKAKELFEKLARNNWDYAEPGMLFWDNITGYNLLNNNPDFEYAGTNPCLTGDSLIQTTEGEIPIQQLVGETPYVYCMDNEGNLTIRKAIKVWKTRENANLVEIVTGKGKIRCTPDHRIYTTNRGWVEAKDLQHGDKIKGLNRQTTGHKYCSVGLSGGKYEKEHRFLARHFWDIEGMDVHHINDNGFDNRLSNLEVISHEEHSRLSNTGRIIEVNRDENTGRYLCKDEHTARNCKNLGKEVGTNWFVYSVTELDYTEDVYDMTVEDAHNFIANGFVVHNCAEEPLPAGGSCLLGSINLSEFVLYPFTDKAQIDWDSLEEATRIAVRALNQVLIEGITLHPLEEQQESVSKWRQIGLITRSSKTM